MKTILLSILIISIFTSLSIAGGKKIERIGKDKQYLYVEGKWENNAKCIKLVFSTSVDIESKALLIKTYFYDSDGKVVLVKDMPSSINDSGNIRSSLPDSLKAGKSYTVYFGIPEIYTKGSKKWKRAVVILGDTQSVVAQVYPPDDVSKFAFPEKGLIKN